MNSGRPKEFDPKHALSIAMNLFWKKGYEATSLQDLITAMDLSKSSFYQTFESKHNLFLKCIEHYQNEIISLMNTALSQKGSSKRNIEKILLSIANEAKDPDKRHGCLVMNTASEIGQHDQVVASVIEESVLKFESLFISAVKQGQEEGSICSNREPKAIAHFLMTSLAGLKNMVKAGKSSSYIRKTVEITMSVL